MIHVNRGDGKHEWLTADEYEAKYGKIPAPGPYLAEGEALRKQRVDEGISLRELAKEMDVKMSWLSGLEHGREKVTPQIKEAYQVALLAFAVRENRPATGGGGHVEPPFNPDDDIPFRLPLMYREK